MKKKTGTKNGKGREGTKNRHEKFQCYVMIKNIFSRLKIESNTPLTKYRLTDDGVVQRKSNNLLFC